MRCLARLRRAFLSNIRHQAVGPDGVVEQVAVVLLCVMDVAESVVNGVYLFPSPTAPAGLAGGNDQVCVSLSVCMGACVRV